MVMIQFTYEETVEGGRYHVHVLKQTENVFRAFNSSKTLDLMMGC